MYNYYIIHMNNNKNRCYTDNRNNIPIPEIEHR